ncbi:MAG: PTS sugar transporter subunit IIC, partial [Deltaproteobacteria bacterium]|nr:PTS sugar transporter subunit IIC [Deltaproteobacteria bacterium]
MVTSSVGVALLGGALCLDRILLQVMVSRPIVICPVLGIVLGEAYTGLIIGAFTELLFINRFVIGTRIPPNDSLVSVLIAAGSILAGRELGHLSRELITLAILLFLPLAILGQKLDVRIVKLNEILSKRAIKDAESGNIQGMSRNHLFGIRRTYSIYVVFIFIFLLAGTFLLVSIFPLLPDSLIKALTYAYFFVPLLGVSVALSTIEMRGTIPVFSGLFLVFIL